MNCRLCQSAQIAPCFSLGAQPLANKYPLDSYEMKNEHLHDMDLNYCSSCRSLQITQIISRTEMFEDYYYLSSVNPELVQHFRKMAEQIADRGHTFVVDIGSNDGVLLQPLSDHGIRALGVDPSENVGKIANDKGLETLIEYFDQAVADQIIEGYGRPTCVVASSVFTHLENPQQFLSAAKSLISPNGEIIIEIEYLPTIIEDVKFERFYFDRPNYYSLTTINELAQNVGLKIHEAVIVDTHGGSVRVHLSDKECRTHENSENVNDMLAFETDVFSEGEIKDAFEKFQNFGLELKETLVKFKESGCLVIGYGAPARLATISTCADINSSLIRYIIDDSPLKAGRHSPGQHIPIKTFEQGTSQQFDVVIVFAYEYKNSILERLKNYRFKAFSPIPMLPLEAD